MGGYITPEPWDLPLAVVWAGLLTLLLAMVRLPRKDRFIVLLLWVIKAVITLSAVVVYEHAFFTTGLDSYGYYTEAMIGPPNPEHLVIGSGTNWVVGLTWLHLHLVPDSYHAAKLTFSFLGMVGIYLTYRASVQWFGDGSPARLWLLGLYPSAIFWSSVLGKEPVVLLGWGLFSYGIMAWKVRLEGKFLLAAGIGLLLCTLIRLWLGVVLLLPSLILVLFHVRGVIAKGALLACFALVLFAAGALLAERFQLEGVGDLTGTGNTLSTDFSGGGSGRESGGEFVGVGGLIAFAPLGIFSALFRPLPLEVNTPFGIAAGIENAILIFFALKGMMRTRWADFKDPLFVWVTLLVVTWATFYGFVSSHNMGTAVRYRLQVLPLFLVLLIYLNRRRNLNNVHGPMREVERASRPGVHSRMAAF